MANDAAQLAKCINTAIAMTTMMAPAINSRQPPGRFLTFPQCGQVGADELTSRPHSEQLVSAIMSTGYGRTDILTRQQNWAQATRVTAHSVTGFGSPRIRRASARTVAGAFFMARHRRVRTCQLYGGRRGAPQGAPVLVPVFQPASSVTLFGSRAADSISTRGPQ